MHAAGGAGILRTIGLEAARVRRDRAFRRLHKRAAHHGELEIVALRWQAAPAGVQERARRRLAVGPATAV